jgi:hypothetical protein
MLGPIAQLMRRGRPHDSSGWMLVATRVGLPALLIIAGAIMIAIGHGGTNNVTAVTGLVLIGIALMVGLLNWLFRMSVESNQDREREELAREYFDRHGHWPDEPPE